jgi:hypothetical protein
MSTMVSTAACDSPTGSALKTYVLLLQLLVVVVVMLVLAQAAEH